MSERARILASAIAVMVVVAVGVATTGIVVLNHVSFERQRERLVQVVQHRARILKEVASFDAPLGTEVPSEVKAVEAARLEQILQVFSRFGHFGKTGELFLAKRQGDEIVWLIDQRHEPLSKQHPTPFDSERAEPMRRALTGESGTLVGLDYRGERVLAAYEPVPGLGWGVVAEIDVAEIDQPFLQAALLSAVIAILVTLLGAAVMFRVTTPLVARIERRVAERTAQLSQALIEQEHLQEELRRSASETALAEERERRKLAVDLHDGLGQLLTVASMRLGMLRDSVQTPALVSEVKEVERVVSEADERVSSLSFELSPPILHDVGLTAATHSLAEDIRVRFGLDVTVEDDGERRTLDEATRITLFRALGELLLNVRKHAQTDKARVRIWQEDGFIKVVVEDHGVGFDSGASASGYGLFSIRERLNHLGGSMRVESEPGRGTRISMMAPARRRDSETDEGSA